jgi:hypothetical protein
MTDSREPRPDDEAPLNDVGLTRKDRSYSPSSDRETAEKQDAAAAGEAGEETPDGVKQLPGTGGPDDAGDTEIVGDEIDPSVIVERGSTEHQPGDA